SLFTNLVYALQRTFCFIPEYFSLCHFAFPGTAIIVKQAGGVKDKAGIFAHFFYGNCQLYHKCSYSAVRELPYGSVSIYGLFYSLVIWACCILLCKKLVGRSSG